LNFILMMRFNYYLNPSSRSSSGPDDTGPEEVCDKVES
jgi:hypothetical protein